MNIGQHVVCIDDFFAPEIAALYDALPKEGEQYVIRAMHEGNNRDDGKPEKVLALLLVGLVNPCPERAGGKERGFNSKRFRPLYPAEQEGVNDGDIRAYSGNPADMLLEIAEGIAKQSGLEIDYDAFEKLRKQLE